MIGIEGIGFFSNEWGDGWRPITKHQSGTSSDLATGVIARVRWLTAIGCAARLDLNPGEWSC